MGKDQGDNDLGNGSDRFMRGAPDREQPSWKNRDPLNKSGRKKSDPLWKQIIKALAR